MSVQTASAEAIGYHYDVSNEFYRLWLDQSMTYSAALWEDADDLHAAQRRKMDWHLGHLALPPGGRLLDIGCGWGGLLEHAARTQALRSAVGLTLSAAQKDWIDRKSPKGMAVALQNWTDHACAEPYDGIVSIGAFEHFARPNLSRAQRVEIYRHFFERAHAWLVPGGSLSVQTIGCGNMQRSDFSEFFATEIFPDSDLPCLDEIVGAMRFLFEVKLIRNDRHHYARTLREWLKHLGRRKEEAVNAAGAPVVERYLTYFKLAIVAFEQLGTMDLYRLALKRIDKPRSRA